MKTIKHTQEEMDDYTIESREVHGQVVTAKIYKYFGPKLANRYENSFIKPALTEDEMDAILDMWSKFQTHEDAVPKASGGKFNVD